tara:strand:+ start:6229 stop:6396 length:168 start_codon:yes stop_codon:yes gene_type:complete
MSKVFCCLIEKALPCKRQARPPRGLHHPKEVFAVGRAAFFAVEGKPVIDLIDNCD